MLTFFADAIGAHSQSLPAHSDSFTVMVSYQWVYPLRAFVCRKWRHFVSPLASRVTYFVLVLIVCPHCWQCILVSNTPPQRSVSLFHFPQSSLISNFNICSLHYILIVKAISSSHLFTLQSELEYFSMWHLELVISVSCFSSSFF